MIVKDFAICIKSDPNVSYKIDGGYVGKFHVGGTGNCVIGYGCNSVDANEYADSVWIEISKNAEFIPIPDFTNPNPDDTDCFVDSIKFETIVQNLNITALSFNLITDNYVDITTKHYTYKIPWDSMDGHTNLRQKSVIGGNENLYIVIDDKALTDVFSPEDMDEETIDDETISNLYEFNGFGEPILAVQNDYESGLRIFRLSSDKSKCKIRIGGYTGMIHNLSGKDSAYEIVMRLIPSLLECLCGYDSTVNLYENSIFEFKKECEGSIEMIYPMPAMRNQSDEEHHSESVCAGLLDCYKFIDELLDEINENIEFWSDFDEEKEISLIEQMYAINTYTVRK